MTQMIAIRVNTIREKTGRLTEQQSNSGVSKVSAKYKASKHNEKKTFHV